jgi:hypothetical protein
VQWHTNFALYFILLRRSMKKRIPGYISRGGHAGRQLHLDRESRRPPAPTGGRRFAREPATGEARTMNIPRARAKHSRLRAPADAQGGEEPPPGRPDGIVPGTTPPVRIVSGRLFGVGAGAFGVPAGAWLIWPVFGIVVISAEIIVVLAVGFTALYGSNLHSRRAFRLLRWSSDRSEPPARRGPGRPD